MKKIAQRFYKANPIAGISLIILVITIIVVIILAAAVIFSIQKENPIDQATKARLFGDVDNFKSELELYKQNVYLNKVGNFNPDTIQANNLLLKQNGQTLEGKNIYSVIPSLQNSEYQDTDFAVIDGKLVYRGENKNYQDWLNDTGKVIVDKGNIVVLITLKQNLPIRAGTDVEYDISILSDQGLKQVDEASILSKIEVVDNTQVALSSQPNKQIKNLSRGENSLSMQLVIDTTTIQNGKYTIKLNEGMVENNANKQSDEIVDTKDMFEIDSSAPVAPDITLSTTEPTNQDITVTIIYPDDAAVKQYKIGSGSWTDYTVPFSVSSNCTVYAIAKDSAGNQSSESTVNITNIDKESPAAPAFELSATEPTNQDVTVTITYPSDAAIKQYRINDGNWTDYTAPFTVSSNCTVYAITKDSAGNQSSESTVNITNIDKVPPTAPIVNLNGYTSGTWTKNDVKIDLSSTDDKSGIQKYQYSYDGINWNDISNSYTVNYDCNYYITYRAIDKVGNASSNAVTNIIKVDKSAPTYSSYEIKNVSSTGYDVYIYGVTDNYSGINRIQFPTWTDYNGQDDLVSDWWANSAVTGQNQGNGTWYFRVNSSSHNNEGGQYQTHVYIYDNIGNYTMFVSSGASLSNTSSGDNIKLYEGQIGSANGTQYIDSNGTIHIGVPGGTTQTMAGFTIFFKNPITIPSMSGTTTLVSIYGDTAGIVNSWGTMGGANDFNVFNNNWTLISGRSGYSTWPVTTINMDPSIGGWGPESIVQQQISSIIILAINQGNSRSFGFDLAKGTKIRITTTSGYYYVIL